MAPTAKPDCFTCKYRQDVPGSAHSTCKHPVTTKLHDDPLIALLVMLARAPVTPPDVFESLGVTCNMTGYNKGWFNWPLNFDPTWLLTCDGYTAKEKSEQHGTNR